MQDSFILKDRFTIRCSINNQYEWEHNEDNVLNEDHNFEHRPARKSMKKQETMVDKRNARERTRVRTVNQAFVILKSHLPSLRTHTKRVSKLKILNAAIRYIDSLDGVIKGYNANLAKVEHHSERHRTASTDHSLFQIQPMSYVQTLLDHPSHVCSHATSYSQNFVTTNSSPFFLSSSYP